MHVMDQRDFERFEIKINFAKYDDELCQFDLQGFQYFVEWK